MDLKPKKRGENNFTVTRVLPA